MENSHEYTSSGLLPFDPIVLMQDLWKRILIVILAALVAGFGVFIYTDQGYVPQYQTTTTFVVTARGSSTSVYSNLTSTSTLASVFTELLNSSIMRKTIVQAMGVPNFDGTISTSVIPGTNLITMTVTDNDPRSAFLAAQTIVEHHEQLTYQVVDGIVLDVLRAPTVPTRPRNVSDASPKMKRAMLLASVAAAAVLVALSFYRDAVRSGQEARKKLDCEYLGEIPHEQKYKTLRARIRHRKTSILISNPVTGFRFVENIRKLSHRVEQSLHDRRVLMVTSLLENEGKSTVAVNLALAMAQKHEKVLLIDCDLHKPACHAVLDLKKFPISVNDVIMGKAEAEQALVHYKSSNLDLLFAKSSSIAADIIASQEMADLLQWAKENYELVILDLPPMSASSDAESMGSLADASLLVVRQNMAVTPALNKAIASLEGCEAKLLGCVLNNVYSTRLSSGEGYGYGYGTYGKYGKYGKYGAYGRYASKKQER